MERKNKQPSEPAKRQERVTNIFYPLPHDNVSPDTPLDAQGFFKSKVDSELLRRFTCGCDGCLNPDKMISMIVGQGVNNNIQIVEIYDRYKKMAVDLHHARLTGGGE